ncbi:triose-phosphate isomerase [Clostridium luticellarii]|jgi:triosephosphate isomerase|uniref:Triosephosphate isomerase n=1 Tax=Clostridium luticellarii TaxID=1691940 RepID=A0A2T0BLD9_9CLOT|nr:triose-phosphate isomerase [Clostridium luticellarii]MCI1945401.1 triose-phosphate isomerase [Clostridium luticellarii]MCI1968736.1 triose-phosphate isomerase [Clostridium luticellarii]MCI1994909.1 triose-phosphate isomerase [Clostridium luticellarii]MCI2040162.1 triose-phosphate isomerase [Clostridium luticellarii]PRR84695.1 Triosephosphate isomerase [Clostridium luticellarii]
MRKPIIAGNWKMNKTADEALKLVEELKPLVKDAKCDVVVCPPYVCLETVIKSVKGTNIRVGAQNMHYEESGAYTGEISPDMLKSVGIDYVIIGHSERRQYFGETDEMVNKKVKKAFQHDIIPIVCCGETLEEREAKITEEVLGKQVKLDLQGLDKSQVEKVVVAYEPIWAIGTGKTATDEQANKTIGYIRSVIASMYSKETAEKTRIQYGGSVKPATIKAQMTQPEIDGALVGGASLKSADFAAIVNY